MIKKFFISMLGTMAGIWISIFILLIGSIFAVSILIAKNAGTGSLPEEKILWLKLEGEITERYEPASLQDIIQSGSVSAPLSLEDILKSIYKASDDKNVKGIYLDCRGAAAGIASREEIVEALHAFSETGKWIIAYGDEYTQGDYILAAAADQIYLNPVGMIDIHGLQSNVMFFTDLLKKFGIEMQIFKVGEFKSAVEPFIRMNMSEPSRLQTRVFLDRIWSDVAQMMTRDSVDVSTITMAADSVSMTWPAQRFVDLGLASKLAYRNEAEDYIRSTMSLSQDDDLPLVTPNDYLLSDLVSSAEEHDHVAVLYASGDIVVSGGGIASEDLVPQILKLAKNKKVKGLVLRVNSGGGSAFASEQIWYALEQFKAEGKPFYVSMGDYAASGGYYISCGADSIFADRNTLTGSIGIFGMLPCANELITQKIGIGIDTVATSPNADFPSPYFRASPTQAAAMQRNVERGYDLFTSRVAEGRKISQDSVKVIGGGRVWDGQTALSIGLVDRLAPLHEVVDLMTEELNLGSADVVSYPKIEDDLWATLFKLGASKTSIEIQGIPAEEALIYVRYLRQIRNLDPVQARMENIIIR